ncbi:hypothetical protein [Pseudactinotalea sp.]|uniref:hypothetical protein n=1 Tax=Pseudactinotalea sp. TaxID=1926260 RepID=UPI003B3B0B75
MSGTTQPIDREALVARHRPRVREVLPQWPLQLGNGSLGFAADVTGLQTYPQAHPHRYRGATGTLLGTMSQWGWHSTPPPRTYHLSETERRYETTRGPRPYVDLTPREPGIGEVRGNEAEEWLRNNPHRLQLARIGFVTATPITGLGDLAQDLDLWTGILTSSFRAPEHARVVTVTTAVHPTRDALAVVSGTGWPVRLAFPYGSESWALADDWASPQAHTTGVAALTDDPATGLHRWRVDRKLDATRWTAWITTNAEVERTGAHELTVVPPLAEPLRLVVELCEGEPGVNEPPPLTAQEVLDASSQAWPAFWRSGAALDLGDVDDPRAAELERRAVLSQYLTRINCAAALPPSETGLLTNSWRGKVHLEMHWWHVAHFALWGRPELIEASLDWYATILESARDTAQRQGYDGARWPKQVGPEGRESPSEIGTFLLWQQPHPIHLAELVIRAHRAADRHARADELRLRWAPLVTATADFMADIAEPRPHGGFGLGPPLVPAQESYGAMRARVTDPTFELAYWRWALLVARRWHEELSLQVPASWTAVADGLIRPLTRDGELTAIGVDPWTIRTDHPSMLAAYGVVPPVDMVDPDVASRTLDRVLADWDWASTWGWDYPVIAMTASRLHRPEDAVDGLLAPVAKNEHGPNGHNRQDERLPAYLPGNGGLLAALGLMAAGWDDGPAQPGFPADWQVRHEGFVRSPGGTVLR